MQYPHARVDHHSNHLLFLFLRSLFVQGQMEELSEGWRLSVYFSHYCCRFGVLVHPDTVYHTQLPIIIKIFNIMKQYPWNDYQLYMGQDIGNNSLALFYRLVLHQLPHFLSGVIPFGQRDLRHPGPLIQVARTFPVHAGFLPGRSLRNPSDYCRDPDEIRSSIPIIAKCISSIQPCCWSRYMALSLSSIKFARKPLLAVWTAIILIVGSGLPGLFYDPLSPLRIYLLQFPGRL